MSPTKKTTKEKKPAKPHQVYGFIMMLVASAIFVFLLILPMFDIRGSAECEGMELKIGENSYPFPILLLVFGFATILDIGPAIVKRIIGDKK